MIKVIRHDLGVHGKTVVLKIGRASFSREISPFDAKTMPFMGVYFCSREVDSFPNSKTYEREYYGPEYSVLKVVLGSYTWMVKVECKKQGLRLGLKRRDG